ncbi:nuclear pore complex protein DDB_G0274915-like [Leptopilina heterotoma]|uniref:nuclear pore complex protein DDB_G0274915-like n=1 Tax=Leptopilina heterotoma TaxID=63436 RepID=UPI001CA9171A|nr:nuclear pore complex protein DDB_G0274915-like [Leptopilina heterotoma]
MVVCKYFQQGSCRFGQYCRYEHINNYGSNANRSKTYDGKNITLIVAEDILAAERGGQWLLSCFGPFKEQPCIPGMSDLSPEEVRWEMYQAEKKGTVEQVKMQFQQLCQEMKVKRDALKNPTPQLVTVLENLQKSGQDSAFGASSASSKSNFSFATPQLGNTTSTNTNANVFGAKSFGTSSNPFGGSFSSTSGNAIFGGSSAATSSSVFGSKPAFGSNSVFGATPSTTSLFGGATTPAFGTQTTQSFGTSQNSSVFGGAAAGGGGGVISQPVFGQTSAFGTPQNNSFLRPASTVATTSVFGNNASSTFGGSAPPSFGNPGVFGNAGSAPAFGTTSTSSAFGSTTTTSAFGAKTTQSAFGGAPVFGGTSAFGNSQSGSIFGAQTTFAPATTGSLFGGSTTNTFNNSTTSGMNLFGAGTASTPFGGGGGGNSFGQPAVSGAPFGQTTMAVSSTFGQTTNAEIPFGQTTTAGGGNFGQTAVTSGTPFGPQGGAAPFGQTAPFASTSGPFSTTTAPFSQNAPFGQTVTATDSSSMSSEFGIPVTAPPPFGAQINFGNAINSPFSSTNTTVTTATSNPFMSTPFGGQQQNQNYSTAGPFTKSVGGVFSLAAIFDELAFSAEGCLTDDQKNCYLQDKFTLGKIPLRVPTKELS